MGRTAKRRNVLIPLGSVLLSLLRKEVSKGEFEGRQKNEWKYEQILSVVKSGCMWIVHLQESLHCAPGMCSHHEFWVACRGLIESHRIGQSSVYAPAT